MQKRFFTVLAFVAGMFAMQTTNAQVLYSEDFEGTGGVMPSNLTIIDGDASAANVNVADIDNWSISPSTETATIDSVAAVTSWLATPGASDDWLITPQVTGITSNTALSWEAVARDPDFADGYEVWVTSSIAGTTPVISDFTTGGTRVFQIASEDTSFAARSVSLAAFANQSVYVGFRNNSNDQFVLEVDDIVIQNVAATDDLGINGIAAEYTIYPLSQAEVPLIANIGNLGTTNATDAVLTANVLLGGAVQQTFTSPATALAAGGNVTLNLGNYTPSATGTYTIEYIVSSATLNDNDATNDTARYGVLVDDNYFARDNAAFQSGPGAGPGTEVVAGQIYNMIAAGQMDSVLFFVAPGEDGFGDSVQVVITDVVNGIPTNQIGESDFYVLTAADTTGQGAILQLAVTDMLGGALTFTQGDIFVGIKETASGDYINLITTSGIYTPATTFVSINNGAYQDITSVIPTLTRPFVIRPYITTSCPTIAASTTVTNANCTAANGSATVTATGGTAPYTYMWDTAAAGQMTATANNLVAGTYNVTVTDDNGCTGTTVATVGSSVAILSTNSSSTDAGCGLSDGTATVSVSGGTTPYSYMWDGAAAGQMTATANNLPAGSYNVTIEDANGCSVARTIAVDNPNAPTASSAVTSNYNGVDVSCFNAADGDALASASGGTTPYTYEWSDGQVTAIATGLAGGTYTVSVTDAANCVATSTVVLTEPTAVTATIASSMDAACFGDDGMATAAGTGGTGAYTYLWMGAGQGTASAQLPADTHTVMITDANGCSDMDSVIITEPTALSATATDNGNGTATAAATGGTAPYVYIWDNGQNTATANFTSNGTYSVTATDNNGCTFVTSVNVTIVAIDEIATLSTLNIFPNPTSADVMVDLEMTTANEVTLRVVNTTGQTVINRNLGTIQSDRIQVRTADLTTGVYFMHFTIGTETVSRKLVVSKQ